MEKTSDHPTNMVMLPTGGVLLMSLTPYNDTDSRFEILHCWSYVKFSEFDIKYLDGSVKGMKNKE